MCDFIVIFYSLFMDYNAVYNEFIHLMCVYISVGYTMHWLVCTYALIEVVFFAMKTF